MEVVREGADLDRHPAAGLFRQLGVSRMQRVPQQYQGEQLDRRHAGYSRRRS